VGVLLIPAFVLTFFIKEVPLRATGGLAAAQAENDDAESEARGKRAEAATAVV